jgi:hypothetical protein
MSQGEAGVERGGLGGDPAVTAVGTVVDFGDRAGVGDFAEHREGSVGFGWSAEVSAPAGRFNKLHRQIPDIAATEEPAGLLSAFVHGIKRLPVAWTPPR